MKKFLVLILTLICTRSFSQLNSDLTQQHWVDSVFNSLSDDQRIAQLMVVRVSTRSDKGVVWYDKEVAENIKTYNIGALCLFQGNPVKQAELLNYFQRIAKTPLMVCVDAEWGLGMRFDSVANLPFQLTMGAMQDASLI